MKKRLSLLLCLVLVTGLFAGCTPSVEPGGETEKRTEAPTEPTQISTEAPTEAPTEPPTEPPVPDVLEAYRIATENLRDTYAMTVELEVTRWMGDEVFTITDDRQAIVWNNDGKPVIDEQWKRQILGNYALQQFDYHFRYEDGQSKLETNGRAFAAQQEAEAFAWLLPQVLVTADHYDTISWKDDSYRTICFADANDVEWDWSGIDCSDIQEVTAQVTLDTQGRLSEIAYAAEYDSEGIHVEIECSAIIGDVDAALPEQMAEKDAVTLGDLQIVPLMDLASCAFLTDGVSVTLYQLPITYAGAAYGLYQSMISLGTWEDEVLLREHAYSHVYTAADTVSNESDTVIINGEVTYTYNEEEQDLPLDPEETEDVLVEYLYRFWIDPEQLASATLRDEDDCWLIEFELNKDGMEHVCRATEYTLFQDETKLETAVSGKHTGKSGTGYLSIDKGSGMPVNLYVDYEGAHIIQRKSYELFNTYEMNILAGDPYIYDSVMDEPAPSAEPEEPATPLFYKVTNAEGRSMWLLGTIHVGDSRTSHLPREIYDALKSSDALALEIDTGHFEERLEEDDALMEAYQKSTYYLDGSVIWDHMDEELTETARTLIQKYGGQFLADMLNYNLATIYGAMDQITIPLGRQLSFDRGVDNQLAAFAEENGIPVWDVEDYAEHIAVFSSFSDELLKLLVTETAKEGRYGLTLGSKELFDAWCRGDEAELREEVDEDEEDEEADMTPEEKALYDEYVEKMMTYRNAVMMAKAAEYMASGKTVFMAVGMAHLVEEGGLLETLEEAGYIVERVEYGK